MLELIWKSIIVLVAAGIASLLLWRASAAIRHLVWVLALASLLVLPLFESMPATWHASRMVNVPAVQLRIPSESVGGVTHRNAVPRNGLPIAVFVIWLAGAVVCLSRWGSGAARVARMRRTAIALSGSDPAWEVARQAGLGGDVHLLRSPEEIIPLAAGIRHPYVLLPASASQWPEDRLRVVLLHEHAHIRRRDSLTQALAELARCLYWFHPLVWLAARRLCVERERACDDLVLLAGTGASDYASHLLHLAQSLQSGGLSPAAVSMAAGHLETRVRAILNPHVNRRVLSRASAVVACIAAACLVLPLAAMRPQASTPGAVTGTVYDPAGARVPNAIIIASSGASELKTTTGQEGKFTIGPLTGPGPWQLTVRAPGFAQHVQRVDHDHFEIALDVGQIQETVVVHAKGTSAAPAGPQRVRVGGMVVPAKLVYKVDPEYPEDVRSRGIEGNVVLRAVISLKGTILSLTSVSSPDPALTEAALKAVREWRYEPSLLNGEPIETVTAITVNFQLEP
jgi:TonB family protein